MTRKRMRVHNQNTDPEKLSNAFQNSIHFMAAFVVVATEKNVKEKYTCGQDPESGATKTYPCARSGEVSRFLTAT